MKTKLLLAAAAIAAFATAPALAQNVDTTGAFTGDIGNFGAGWATATYGQTFTVGSLNGLDSFTMYLDYSQGSAVNFQAYVYAWNGSRAVGNALYTSAVQQFGATGYGAATGYSFDTTGLNLVSGQQYVAFLTTSGVANSGNAVAYMPFSGSFGSNAYSGGDFVFSNNSTLAQLTSNDWDGVTGGAFGDAQFKASFSQGVSPVPEPAAWGMMIGGFALAGGAIRSRRRKLALA